MASRWVGRLILSACIAWIAAALLAAFTPLADWLVLPPRWDVVAAPAGQTRLTVKGAGGQVELWQRMNGLAQRGQRPRLHVLCFCGQGDQAQQKRWDVTDLIDDVPLVFTTMNYPGYGGTSGPSTLSQIGPCALAAYDSIRAADPSGTIIVSGYSLGAVPALYVAARRPVSGAVIINPPNLSSMVLRQGWWNLWAVALPLSLAIPDELDSIKNAAAIRAPGMLVGSSRDEVVPYAVQQAVLQAYGGEKRTLMTTQRHDMVLDEPLTRDLKSRLQWLVAVSRRI